jgi:hypothetical protein
MVLNTICHGSFLVRTASSWWSLPHRKHRRQPHLRLAIRDSGFARVVNDVTGKFDSLLAEGHFVLHIAGGYPHTMGLTLSFAAISRFNEVLSTGFASPDTGRYVLRSSDGLNFASADVRADCLQSNINALEVVWWPSANLSQDSNSNANESNSH